MNEISSRLLIARRNAGFVTATDAARAFGWNENTYRSHENGERGIKPAVASRYAQALKCSLVWLLTGSGQETQGEASTLVGEITDAGSVRRWDASHEVIDIVVPYALPSEAEIWLVFTDSLYPRYSRGDLIGVWHSKISDITRESTKHYLTEGIAIMSDGSFFLGQTLFSRTLSGHLDLINRPPVRDASISSFVPVQVVIRAGMYAVMSYGTNPPI